MGSGISGLYSGSIGEHKVKNYNSAGSSSVKKVNSISFTYDAHSVPRSASPNSVSKNFRDGELSSERYYGKDGKAYLDIDYSDHGNPKTHPVVPHEHEIWFDDNGGFHREKEKGIQS